MPFFSLALLSNHLSVIMFRWSISITGSSLKTYHVRFPSNAYIPIERLLEITGYIRQYIIAYAVISANNGSGYVVTVHDANSFCYLHLCVLCCYLRLCHYLQFMC